MNDRSGATDAGPATRGRDARAHAGTPPICPDPVFVIGSPRSGTTALAHSLARHSLLWASGESDVLYFLLANGFAERSFDRAMELPGRRWLRRERVSRDEFLAYLGIGLNALMTSRSEGRRWIDHTPRYTRIVDTLAEVFPGASFIHILRDGREVVHSMLNFAAAASDPAVRRYLRRSVPWATEVRAACEEWRDHVEIAVSFGEHSDRACVVRYEDLVAAPGDAFAAVHGFLGIADEEGPAASFASRRINSSFKQRARPSGHEAWEGWAEEQRHVFAELAGPTMRRAGYWPADEERTVADTDRGTDGSGHGRRRGLMQAPEYARLVARVREIVESDTPPGSEVLVATRGDDGFLDLDGRRGWHFPRERDGGYAGRYPADSAAAIAHLEELRAQGATHLALPGSAFWWLDYYEGLREHLDAAYPVIRRDENVIAYDLRAGRAAHGEPAS